MPKDIIQAVNKIGRQEGMLDGIQFRNIDKESTFSNLYTDDDSQDNNSCASDVNWKMEENTEKELKKFEFDININIDDNDMKDLNNEDALHLNNGLADNNNAEIEDIGVINEHDDQHNQFGTPDDNI